MTKEAPEITRMIVKIALVRIFIVYVGLRLLAAITIEGLIDRLPKDTDGSNSALAITLHFTEVAVLIALAIFVAREWNKYDRKRGYFLSQFLRRQRKLVQEGLVEPIELNKQVRSALRTGWRIDSILSTVERPNKFLIHIKKTAFGRTSDLLKYPDVFINGIKGGSHLSELHDARILNDAVLLVNPEAALLKNPLMLVFELRHENGVIDSQEIHNSYYVNPRWLKHSSFRWQCEGHADEKIIIIRPDQQDDEPWDPKIRIAMNFDLLVNKRLLGTFRGIWEKDLREWHIPIHSVLKHECVGKQAVIRITHLQGIKQNLPEPMIMSRDYVRVA